LMAKVQIKLMITILNYYILKNETHLYSSVKRINELRIYSCKFDRFRNYHT